MEETHNNRTALAKGAKDIAKEAKKHAGKNFGKAVDRASDEYSTQRSYSRFQDEDEEENAGAAYGGQDGRSAGNAANDDDEASSDATEGHDDEDEIYEGEYQGVPARDDGKPRDGQVALGQPVCDSQKSRKELESERQSDEEELAQQYELIMQECGHGRFQWQLFFVLGLALMSDGVEVFVVGFVLPSAETDMCVPNSGTGWLGKHIFHSSRPFSRVVCFRGGRRRSHLEAPTSPSGENPRCDFQPEMGEKHTSLQPGMLPFASWLMLHQKR